VIAQLFLSGAIAAVAMSAGAPTSADPGNPFNHLWMDSRCSTPAPATVCHSGISQVQAGIQDGSHDMQPDLSAGRRPS